LFGRILNQKDGAIEYQEIYKIKKHMSYYSQLGQDKFIDDFFNKKENGIFVDVGANDGITLSNTFFLEKERNWEGICIEPLPLEFKKLSENRKSINLNLGVSNFEGESDFTYVEGCANMLSGISDTFNEKHINYINDSVKKHGDKIHNIKIYVKKLQTILDEYNIKDIDFCSIDTEGSEFNVISSIDFNKTKIKIFIIENNYNDVNVKELLESKGYTLYKKISQDNFFIKNELINN
jgi:FkbM family methyltransferase